MPKRILIAIVTLCSAASYAGAELVLRYTFDDADVVGSTLIDSVGGSNALVVGNVGLGVPGVLGEAIRLPNDDGASYAVLPSGSNPAPNGNAARTIAFWFNQEEVGVENKMFGYGNGGSGQSFDVSLEGGGIRLRYSGGNVTWGSGFDFTGANAGFNHLAIRVPTGAQVYTDIDVFLNGTELVGTPTAGSPASTAINTGGGLATTLNLGRSPAFAPAGDFIGLLDDFRVYSSALSDAEIFNLADALESLLFDIDPVTGQLALRNPTDTPIALDYYEISSSSAALSASGWASLESQDRGGFAAGSGAGDGWETLGAGSTTLLAEGTLGAESVIGPGESFSLGQPINPFVGLDVAVTYRSGGAFQTARLGNIKPGVIGDYNGNGALDAADYTVWRDALGSTVALLNDLTPGAVTEADYAAWRDAFGGAAASVPEPTAGLLLLVSGLWPAGTRRR